LGVGLDLDSPFLPADATLADCTLIAALQADHAIDDLTLAFHRAAFLDRQNIEAPQTLARLADQCGLPGSRLVAAATSVPVTALYRQNVDDAVADNVFGAPSFVREGEVFWGQDRLELLAEAIASARPPFAADV
jgi:2-hydroxychromene-2-carboxylate isomerase